MKAAVKGFHYLDIIEESVANWNIFHGEANVFVISEQVDETEVITHL